ncbi:MAG: hypothetical protein EBS09_08115 [Flavobacteriia bacterium]|jgi:hypothetical protein|nr:hypothetical protein [Flavobacteriia bacterium]NBV68310.1 hypothetical protein [Flavobacteriia bacterium]NBY39998.1 hypothetical protein [Flavobacteriia bacterium]
MKNLFMSIALLTFMGSMAAKVYASTTEVKMELRDDDKKKKKKKKACCSAQPSKCCSAGDKKTTTTDKH